MDDRWQLFSSGRYIRPAAAFCACLAMAFTFPACASRTRRPPEASGTTVGRNLRAISSGTVVPETSLGVDLVEATSIGASVERDVSLGRASANLSPTQNP